MNQPLKTNKMKNIFRTDEQEVGGYYWGFYLKEIKIRIDSFIYH